MKVLLSIFLLLSEFTVTSLSEAEVQVDMQGKTIVVNCF